MNNTELLAKAIKMLSQLEPKDLESISIKSSQYNDGSKYLEIDVDWPGPKTR